MLRFRQIGFATGIVMSLTLFSSCMSAYRRSVGSDPNPVSVRTYFTDVNTAWQSTLEALKASPLEVTNSDAGFVQTKWIDNTEAKNFADSFGDADTFLKAQYRFKVNVSSTFYNGQPAVKVVVQKEQVVERDVLEGPRRIETDTIDENTLLYRIGRLIYMRMKKAKIEQDQVNKEVQDVKF